MKNPFDLSGQVAVITGSSKGIGRSAAEIMASLGAKVVDLQPQGRRLRGGGRGASRRPAARRSSFPATSPARRRWRRWSRARSSKWGRIDTLVCNAAVNPYFGPLAEHPRRRLRQDHELQHQEQPVALQSRHSRHGREGRRQRRHRLLDRRPARQRACSAPTASPRRPTCSSTRSLAVEWGPKNVRINCVAPGLVKTDFARALWEDAKRLKRTRVDRAAAPHRRAGRDRRHRRLPGLARRPPS